MLPTSYLTAFAFVGVFTSSGAAFGQDAPSNRSHIVVVKLVNTGGSMPDGFAPSNVTAQRGDTVRFVEDAGVIHNVHFKAHPRGAKLVRRGH
jgi:plastocyanin